MRADCQPGSYVPCEVRLHELMQPRELLLAIYLPVRLHTHTVHQTQNLRLPPSLPLHLQEPLYLMLDDPSEKIAEVGRDCAVAIAVSGERASAGIYLSFGSPELLHVFMRRIRGEPHDNSELATLGMQTAKRQQMAG